MEEIKLSELEKHRRKALREVYKAIDRMCTTGPASEGTRSKSVLNLAQAAEALNDRGVLQCR